MHVVCMHGGGEKGCWCLTSEGGRGPAQMMIPRCADVRLDLSFPTLEIDISEIMTTD